MVHINNPLLLIEKSSPCGSGYPNGLLPYAQHHRTVNKINVLSASLNIVFLSFLVYQEMFYSHYLGIFLKNKLFLF